MAKEQRRKREENLQEVCYFNEDDEMVVEKVEQGTVLPDGYAKLNRSQTVNYKIERDMSGEKFIENLERINKRRVEQNPEQAEETAAADGANAGAAEEKNEAVVLDLNPKKQKKSDNLYMDLMALYSRASVNDKRSGSG